MEGSRSLDVGAWPGGVVVKVTAGTAVCRVMGRGGGSRRLTVLRNHHFLVRTRSTEEATYKGQGSTKGNV